MTPKKDFLNAIDAAQLLKVNVETIRRLARNGGIPACKVGRGWRIMIDTLIKSSGSQHYKVTIETKK